MPRLVTAAVGTAPREHTNCDNAFQPVLPPGDPVFPSLLVSHPSGEKCLRGKCGLCGLFCSLWTTGKRVLGPDEPGEEERNRLWPGVGGGPRVLQQVVPMEADW